MIDRIEELLAELAAEDEEEQEDVPALPAAGKIAPASKGETGAVGTEDVSGAQTAEGLAAKRSGPMAGELAAERVEPGRTGDGSGGRAAGEIAPDRSEPIAGEKLAESAEAAAGELWKDGPVWTVRGVKPETAAAQRTKAAEWTAQAEEAFQTAKNRGSVWAGLERGARGGTASTAVSGAGRSGLEGLYRRTVQGLRPAAPALPPEQAGRVARAQEPGSAASLAVDELDRAVRRDSRRYDGGMSIY